MLGGSLENGRGAASDETDGATASLPVDFLVVDKEEEFVSQDRSPDGDSPGVLLERGIELDPVLVVAKVVAVASVEIGRSLEVVGAALCHYIDRGAGKFRLPDVERSRLHFHRLHGVHRNRRGKP